MLRLVIETRKDQMERQRWRIRPRAGKLKRNGASLDADTRARIAAIEHFFHKPDGVTRWKTWLRALLEDMFVIDAATLFCQRTRSGQLFALHQLDGATIKRVIDDWGRTPLPYTDADGMIVYPPAYQQVLKGMPAVNYSARDIIYRPRNVRAHKVYGYSPVQQVLMTVNIALRRQLWQLDYFTEGSVPDALIGVPTSGRRSRSSSSRTIGTPSSPATSPNAAAPSSCPATARAACIRPRSRITRTTSTNGSPASSALPFRCRRNGR